MIPSLDHEHIVYVFSSTVHPTWVSLIRTSNSWNWISSFPVVFTVQEKIASSSAQTKALLGPFSIASCPVKKVKKCNEGNIYLFIVKLKLSMYSLSIREMITSILPSVEN